MKIIIVGAGISGLTTYLYLRKLLPNPSSHTIIIYESYAPRTATAKLPGPTSTFGQLSTFTAIVGGGLGVAPNGLRVLRDLDPEIHDAVVAQGFVCKKYVFRSARGHRLGCYPTTDTREPEECIVASSRHGDLAVLDGEGSGVVQYRKVHTVFVGKRGKPVVKLGDQCEEEEADLVVGADGVRSMVKKSIFGEEDEGTYKIRYERRRVLEAPVPDDVMRETSIILTFGANEFFGYAPWGPSSKNKMMWWSTYETRELPDRTQVDLSEIHRELEERHGNWNDQFIQSIISEASVDTVYPTYTTPELPHWGEHCMVLLGDAAHALQPTSGQGVSQALESVQTFSLLLAHQLSKCGDESSGGLSVEDAVRLSTKGVYDIRNARVRAIGKQAKKLAAGKANNGVAAEYIMYFLLWLMTSFDFIGKFFLGDSHAILYRWDAHAEIKKYTTKNAESAE